MTKNDLRKILEEFAIVVLESAMSDVSAKEKYDTVANCIEMIADTVMVCSQDKRNLNPSFN